MQQRILTATENNKILFLEIHFLKAEVLLNVVDNNVHFHNNFSKKKENKHYRGGYSQSVGEQIPWRTK